MLMGHAAYSDAREPVGRVPPRGDIANLCNQALAGCGQGLAQPCLTWKGMGLNLRDIAKKTD